MDQTHLSQLLKLRILVGYLGERAQFSWWPTAFFEPSSRLFLEPVFARTTPLSQYHGVTEAARRLHDENLSVGTFHLFRLPEEVEQDLHALMRDAAMSDEPLSVPASREEALASLAAASTPRGDEQEGPTAVGAIADLSAPRTLANLAASYAGAFQRNGRAYPYLVG
jgi:hypothetical protein